MESPIAAIEDPTNSLRQGQVYIQSHGQVVVGPVNLVSADIQADHTHRDTHPQSIHAVAVDSLHIPVTEALVHREESSLLVLPAGDVESTAYYVRTSSTEVAEAVPVTAQSLPIKHHRDQLEAETVRLRQATALLLVFSTLRLLSPEGLLGAGAAATLFSAVGVPDVLRKCRLLRRLARLASLIGTVSLLVGIVAATLAIPAVVRQTQCPRAAAARAPHSAMGTDVSAPRRMLEAAAGSTHHVLMLTFERSRGAAYDTARYDDTSVDVAGTRIPSEKHLHDPSACVLAGSWVQWSAATLLLLAISVQLGLILSAAVVAALSSRLSASASAVVGRVVSY